MVGGAVAGKTAHVGLSESKFTRSSRTSTLPSRASMYVVYAVGSAASVELSVTSYAACGAPAGIGMATRSTWGGPTWLRLSPASLSAAATASSRLSVAGAGALVSRDRDEVTRSTLPSLSEHHHQTVPAGGQVTETLAQQHRRRGADRGHAEHVHRRDGRFVQPERVPVLDQELAGRGDRIGSRGRWPAWPGRSSPECRARSSVRS